jgi:hypothetical protein
MNEQYRQNGPVWDIVINDIARDKRFMSIQLIHVVGHVNTALLLTQTGCNDLFVLTDVERTKKLPNGTCMASNSLIV